MIKSEYPFLAALSEPALNMLYIIMACSDKWCFTGAAVRQCPVNVANLAFESYRWSGELDCDAFVKAIAAGV